MGAVNPYINFKGNCEEAFNMYKSVFGGEIPYIGRYKDMPPSEGDHGMPMDGEKIMHISLQISAETALMGSDIGGEWAKDSVVGDNIQISYNADSEEDAQRIFKGLAEGGHIKMPLEKTFWGALFGMLVDRFGIHWMVNYDFTQENA